jgi:hypothetical protein
MDPAPKYRGLDEIYLQAEGEITTLKIKDVHFDSYGTVLVVNGKTGMRRIRAIFSAPYLSAWVSIHPKNYGAHAYCYQKVSLSIV